MEISIRILENRVVPHEKTINGFRRLFMRRVRIPPARRVDILMRVREKMVPEAAFSDNLAKSSRNFIPKTV